MRSSSRGSLLLLFNSSLCGSVQQKHCEEYSPSVSSSLLLALCDTSLQIHVGRMIRLSTFLHLSSLWAGKKKNAMEDSFQFFSSCLAGLLLVLVLILYISLQDVN